MTLPNQPKKIVRDAKVLAQQELATDVFFLVVEAPEIARFARAGQFVQLRILSGDFTLRRPVGVAAVDEKKGSIAFIYRVVGKGTRALSQLMPGEIVNVLGPLGHGFAMQYKHPLIVGGGMGLSPLLYYAAAMQGKADVLMGGKTAEELFWKNLFDDLCGQCFLTTDDGSLGTKGFTTTVLPELLEKGSYDVVVTCGPEIMMRGVAKIAKEHGIPCEVSLEKRMACGLGAWLSCSIDTTELTASGRFGFGEECADFGHLARLGGVMAKGTTLLPRRGNDGVRITETPKGMLNCIGLENPGVEHFLKETLPRIQQYGMNTIVNISGSTAEDYGKLAGLLDVPGVAAIELNVSCPNVKEGGIVFGTDPEAASAVVRATKAHTKKPVILKLSPNVTDIVAMAKAVEAAGADAVSLINTLLGMEIDIHRFRPVLGNITGGLSGPCVKPVAVRMVWQVAQAVHIPIIGMGGIASAEDAVEFFLAGASAVAVGTANFTDPEITMKICDGLTDYLTENGFSSIEEIVGKANPGFLGFPKDVQKG